MKKVIVILLCLSMIFLSGCYDYTDIENLAYVTAIAVDEGDNGYEYCFQFVNPLSEEGEAVTYSAQGKTLYQAIGEVSKELTRKMSFTHIRMIAVSKEAAGNLDAAVKDFNSSRFYRPDIVLAIAKEGKAAEVLSNIDPALEGNAARYYDLNFSSDNSISKVTTTLKDYLIHNSCVLPVLSGTAIDGIAYIREGGFVSFGNDVDAMCYNLLTEGTKQAVFADALIKSNPPGINDKWQNGKPQIKYSVIVDVSPLSSGVKQKAVKKQLEDKLNTFVHKVTYEYKADVFNIQGRFKRFALTDKQIDKSVFDNIKISVSVK